MIWCNSDNVRLVIVHLSYGTFLLIKKNIHMELRILFTMALKHKKNMR